MLPTRKSLISWWLQKEETGKQWSIQPGKKSEGRVLEGQEQNPCLRTPEQMCTAYVELERIFAWGRAINLVSCWTPAPPRTETSPRRIQTTASVSRIPAPHRRGTLRSPHPAGAVQEIPPSELPASPSVNNPLCQCSGFQPYKVRCFFCMSLWALGESVPDISGRLTTSGPEPQQNCAHCCSDTSSRAEPAWRLSSAPVSESCV